MSGARCDRLPAEQSDVRANIKDDVAAPNVNGSAKIYIPLEFADQKFYVLMPFGFVCGECSKRSFPNSPVTSSPTASTNVARSFAPLRLPENRLIAERGV
ncbi:MAG: hypothetical protein ACREFJ_20885 [Acetobacteraceae bacterium]